MNDKLKLTFNEIDIFSLNIIPKCKRIKSNIYLDVKEKNDYFVKFINKKNIIWFTLASEVKDLKLQTTMFPGQEPVRYPNENEDFANIDIILNNNPDITNIANEFYIHKCEIFLIINMRTTYNILKNAFGEHIPDAKFCIVQEKRLFQKPRIAVVQKKIEGVRLWDLFYFNPQEFEKNRPIISELISKYMDNEHIDYNIKNFILTPDNQLFYVDSKPSYTGTKRTNEHNKKSIMEYIF